MYKLTFAVTALAAAVVFSGCGEKSDGGTLSSSQIAVKSIKVFGDSLSDSGAFSKLPEAVQTSKGYARVFSVQGDNDQNNIIWPERVNQNYGFDALCSVYSAVSADNTNVTGYVANTDPACSSYTNYAVGGSRINNVANGGTAVPLSMMKQITDASSTLSSTDLVLMDGGGNDAADLIGAYLNVSKDGGVAFKGLNSTLLSATVVNQNVANGKAGLANLGGLYMTALANKMADAIDTKILAKGVQRVALLNMPGITNTPRFQMALDGVAIAYGGVTSATGIAARAQSEALFKSWVEAYNTQLANRYAGNSKVVIIDFYTEFNNQVAHPSQYSLTNVKTPACPIVGLGSDGLPLYNFKTCTATLLSSSIPAGETSPDWWRTYAFADGFHPTPFGYRLLGQLVSRSLLQAGWL